MATVLVLSALGLAPGRAAAAPAPDPTFGIGGVADVGPDRAWTDAVELPGGDLVVVGGLRAGGQLQGTFDLVDPVGVGFDAAHPRVVVSSPGADISLEHVERGPRGSVVAFGSFTRSGASGAVVVRVVIGSMQLDPAFGSGGVLTVALPHGTDCTDGDGTVLADGRMLVRCTSSTGQYLVLAELDAAGRPVSTFGAHGVAVVRLPALVSGKHGRIAVLADGRILAAVRSTKGAVGVVRLLGTGTLDRTFGVGGYASRRPLGVRPGMGAAALVVDGSGGIVVAGAVSVHGYTDEPDDDTVVVRFLASGAMDRSFAAGRTYARLAAMDVQRLVNLPNGSLLVAGWRTRICNPDCMLQTVETRLARLSAAGLPLATFGSATPATVQPPGSTQSRLSGVVVGRGGLTVVGPRTTDTDVIAPGFHTVLSRYAPFAFSPRVPRIVISAAYPHGPFRRCGSTIATACPATSMYVMGTLWTLPTDPSRDVTLQVQRRNSSGRWVRLLLRGGWSPSVWTSDHGSFRAYVAVPSRGVFRIRVDVAPSPATLRSASSWVYVRR